MHAARPALLAASLVLFSVAGFGAVDPGEILFSEMNCVACHEAAPPIRERLASRQSPRLGADGVRIVPAHLRAFLENPAAIKPGTLMPDTLHGLDLATKSDAAEELTHYLLSLQKADQRPPPSVNATMIARGRKLYNTVGCVQCHAPQDLPEGAEAKPEAAAALAQLQQTSVPLGPLAEKYTVVELGAFLKDPLQARPAGRMPSLKLDEAEALVIAMYLLRAQGTAGGAELSDGLLYDYYEKELPELPEFDRLKPKTSGTAPTFSLKVAERNGNIALRFRGKLKIAQAGEYRFWTRSDDGSRLAIDGTNVVENGGIHPAQDRDGQVKLTAGAHDIEVVYFDGGGKTELKVQWQPPGGAREEIPAGVLAHEIPPMQSKRAEPFTVDAGKAARGANRYVSLQCAKCHGDLPATAEIAAMTPAARPLAQLRARQPAGCLATNPGPNAPKFELTYLQRIVLLGTLENQAALAEPLAPHEQVRRTMTTLNCYACHQRDRRGGAEGLRREYFASVGDVDLGDEGRIPPHLNGVGAKLQPGWIRDVLTRGAAVRPYMATRMPQFGAANVGRLPELFEQADANADPLPPPNVSTPEMIADANKFGRKLLGTTGLGCIACHNFAGHKSLGVPALDLSLSAQRLKWDWFRRYLLDPQSLRPGTRMPAFWQDGKSSRTDLQEGDAEPQIASIWAYVARKNFAELPPGLLVGKQELIAEKEAVIYRNFIDGGGPRAIGVGYPERANLAFNADELRLALIWQGPFIDAAKHRTGRGEGFEKPLGGNVQQGPPGAPFAVLESESAPWPKEVGRAAGYQFHGYHLDALRRPTFRYSFGVADVEDFPSAVVVNEEAALRRTLTLHTTAAVPERLYFRAAVADRIVEKDGTFHVGENLVLKFPGAKPVIRSSEGRSELLVPVIFSGTEAKLVEELNW